MKREIWKAKKHDKYKHNIIIAVWACSLAVMEKYITAHAT